MTTLQSILRNLTSFGRPALLNKPGCTVQYIQLDSTGYLIVPNILRARLVLRVFPDLALDPDDADDDGDRRADQKRTRFNSLHARGYPNYSDQWWTKGHPNQENKDHH
ncbi:hypothetical protein NW752_006902 [Fusarium irregulare]|uniref:Uncharacterized protein n=1 Tax=Fusarium irregulare TaxID=2494466 RepID=A0A9W8PRW8_9HYPO|nr:hypothetical protein NW766_005782 [Fusarium irregulare]KAJ4015969.1 hypothetical protein NW752_006902 [Fusarium irregulare]